MSIAANSKISIKDLWLDHKVNLLHIKLKISILNGPLEFIEQVLHEVFDVPAYIYVTDIHLCERSLRV
jgi:hypothetical protein